MIPTYDLENLTGGLDIILQNVMRIGFITVIILLTISSIVSLLIWRFGANKKSEKMIKFGIRNFIITLVLIIMILSVPLLFSMF